MEFFANRENFLFLGAEKVFLFFCLMGVKTSAFIFYSSSGAKRREKCFPFVFDFFAELFDDISCPSCFVPPPQGWVRRILIIYRTSFDARIGKTNFLTLGTFHSLARPSRGGGWHPGGNELDLFGFLSSPSGARGAPLRPSVDGHFIFIFFSK